MKLPKLKLSDQPLVCRLEGQHLVIRIGVGTLSWAADAKNHGPLAPVENIINKRQWAKDVAIEILREKEDGSSPLTDMLDNAAREAADNGSIAIDFKK